MTKLIWACCAGSTPGPVLAMGPIGMKSWIQDPSGRHWILYARPDPTRPAGIRWHFLPFTSTLIDNNQWSVYPPPLFPGSLRPGGGGGRGGSTRRGAAHEVVEEAEDVVHGVRAGAPHRRRGVRGCGRRGLRGG